MDDGQKYLVAMAARAQSGLVILTATHGSHLKESAGDYLRRLAVLADEGVEVIRVQPAAVRRNLVVTDEDVEDVLADYEAVRLAKEQKEQERLAAAQKRLEDKKGE